MDTHPELLSARRCALVVVAIEAGGRLSDEAADFVEELAYARARDAQPLLRRAAALAWQRRLSRLLSAACAWAFSQSLVAPAGDVAAAAVVGVAQTLSGFLAEMSWG